jgi:hypothetical protein
VWNVLAAAQFEVTEDPMVTHFDVVTIQPVIALIFGILILFMPRLLNYLVAIYFILIGVIGIWPHVFTRSVELVHGFV